MAPPPPCWSHCHLPGTNVTSPSSSSPLSKVLPYICVPSWFLTSETYRSASWCSVTTGHCPSYKPISTNKIIWGSKPFSDSTQNKGYEHFHFLMFNFTVLITLMMRASPLCATDWWAYFITTITIRMCAQCSPSLCVTNHCWSVWPSPLDRNISPHSPGLARAQRF